mmetsp:Transcript_25991/g.43829  ORF Transcript_25991/g.43829 Transcript_25991/m.43829 type:complete len:124 (+) Transcript_25991:48-419(+)|eukprot:CAMPEP_0114415262 /NCGR_PEP_ID=MMETSP0103-20121206/1819_1 /TAXON_ID=37642 ORGANISM="Paraphysomonas imperforata, Strain PA2" /NCGR_SAMPLE_ID=MMETSP0103 /ASSEMBLY_ACC=CAM_ASM_000201 /LENGTH=123 /DNA_ID=CAMNT_0001583441 /DNA_START=23 /DNA_END=394 /DNA_ORIENTATION=+
MSRPPITFHILDTAGGTPAEGIRVNLHANVNQEAVNDGFKWEPIGDAVTNSDGRGSGLIPEDMKVMKPGVYRMTFHTMEYFEARGTPCFYPKVEVIFKIEDPSQHFHVPLLLSPFGYSTYKGS